MQFYLAAPFCVWCFRRWPALTMTVLFGANYMANQLFGVYGRTGSMMDFGYPSFLPNRIFLFVVGGSYYAYLREPGQKNFLVLVVSAAALLSVVGVKSWLVCLLLIGFLHAAISTTGLWRAFWLRVAESKPVKLMAEWSYGIYLFHMLCVALVAHLIVNLTPVIPARLLWITFAAGVAFCAVLLSALLHYTIERPARDFGKRLTRTPGRRLHCASSLESPRIAS
jgi:peptidoglycan/LPS O-acetylase OafA/YrhL